MSSTTVTCREVWYDFNVLWDDVNQVNYLDPSTPVVDRAGLCALSVDGKLYSIGAPIGRKVGTSTDGYSPENDTAPNQFAEAFRVFYESTNEASVTAKLSGLVNLVTYSYTAEYGV